MKRFLQVLVMLSFPLTLFAEEVKLTVQTDRVLHQLDEKIYGHFFENIYHSADNGIWGELVWNRSFEYNLAGLWSYENGVISQKSRDPQVIQLLGKPNLSDYEFSFEFKKTEGGEGFLLPFHYRSEEEFQWANIGGWGNTKHGFERRLKPEPRQWHLGDTVEGKLEKDQWYKVLLRCEGRKATLSIDGKVILENNDERNLTSGNVGVGTWGTEAEFRNMKIKKLDGTEVPVEMAPVSKMPKHWEIYGNATALLNAVDPLNDIWSLEIAAEGDAGILQKDYCIRKGETYQGSLWVCCGNIESLSVSIPGVTENALKTSGKLRTKKIGTRSWTEIPIEFTASQENLAATLKIGVKNGGKFLVDQVSLMPKSWVEKFDGMRPDLLDALDGLKAPIVRWPGGCYASVYRWKDGVGPQENRKSAFQEMWEDKDPNCFGTDEFMKLCKRLDFEPILVVNLGTRPWYPWDMDRSEFVQDALDWIEYCNGPADSKWGKVRAENGHPEPYNVKYWELDNETWAWPVETYAKAVNEIAPIIRKKYPELKLLVCGSADYGDHVTGYPWNKFVIDHCGEHFDYLSIHHYKAPEEFDAGPREYEAFIARHRDLIAKSKNPNIKIYCSEWNAQSIDWRTGLYCGGVLNGFERVGDIFEIGGPALLMRHTYTDGWNNAFINFNNENWFPGPNYVVMKLYREHFAPNLLALEGDQKGANCVATKTKDGKYVILKFVNPTEKQQDFVVTLDGYKASAASFKLVHSEDLMRKNSYDEPNKIAPKDAEIKVDGNIVRFTLPAHSVGVVKTQP